MFCNDAILSVESGWDLSIADLLRLKEEGYSLVRTNHLGNIPARDLVLLDLGFQVVPFDRNIAAPRILKGANGAKMDTLFLPESICVGGNRDIIAEPEEDKLAASLEITVRHWMTDLLDGEFNSPSPATLHYKSLKKLFTGVMTESQYWTKNHYLCDKLLSAPELILPPHINRKVKNGKVEEIRMWHGTELKERAMDLNLALKQVAETGRGKVDGALYSNALAICLMSAIEAIKTGKERVFQLSGPQMIKYIVGREYREALQNIFALFGKSECADLPKNLAIIVVPTAVISPFIDLPGESAERKDAREEIKNSIKQIRSLRDKLSRVQKGSNNHEKILHGLKSQKLSLMHRMIKYQASGRVDGYADVWRAAYTHYDMLAENRGLPTVCTKPKLEKEFQELSFRALDELHRECRTSRHLL